MIADGSALDCAKTPKKKLELNEFWVDLEQASKGSDKPLKAPFESEKEPDKLRCEFEGFLRGFAKEICATRDTFRPLPPMLGDGQRVDLLKLFLVVREKGGYDAVSENGLWDLVAEEYGLLLGTNVGSSLKLVYIKYLDVLERWLKRVVENEGLECNFSDSGVNFGRYLMELQDELKGFLSKVSDQKKKDELYPHLESVGELDYSGEPAVFESDGDEKCGSDEGLSGLDLTKRVGKIQDGKKVCDEVKGEVVALDQKKPCVVYVSDGENDDDVKSVVVDLDGGKKCDDDDLMILDPATVKESFCGKRKRESLCGLLNWVTGIAKNPCDPVVGLLPESSKWKSYGNEEMWKQVLLAREAIFLKRQVDSSTDQWQKIQKMHPCMYDDQLGSSYNLRERLRCGNNLFSGKTRASLESSSASQSDLDQTPSPCTENEQFHGTTDSSTADAAFEKYDQKSIPLGSSFQAEVPALTGLVSEGDDSKWMGTRVWPLEKVEIRYLIERDPIGKGRRDSCGCQLPGSLECVRFHVAEKRYRLKLELGSAFHHWKFDKMGEEVRLSWTKEEEKKFKTIVRSNPPSLEKCFWDEIIKSFPTKSRADLVSYYFNVFLLHRRGHQNRYTPNNIDSDDDDELESGLVTNGVGHEAEKSSSSILYSPKKPHTNYR